MTPITLPRIGLGTFSDDEEPWAEIVETALEAGYRHVDTAQAYGNHREVGEGIRSADVDREDVFLATKTIYPGLPEEATAVGDAIDTCLAELGVEYVDLLYVHWPSGCYGPAVLDAFDAAYEAEKISHVGLSNFTPDLLDDARAHLDAPLAAHQVEMHPLLDQRELVAYAQDHDHWLVAYSPLAKGEAFDAPVVRAIADEYDATPAQVALAWLHSKDNVAAVPKASSVSHLRDNLVAADLELDPSDVARIDAIEETRRMVDPDRGAWNR